jgi:hypothetical protein
MYFEEEGWVQANNINILNARKKENAKNNRFYKSDDEIEADNEKSSYKGAINAEPQWNDHVGLMILGRKSNNYFANSMDYDMGAFYPSIKIASNMDPSTLLYKAAFDNDEFISGEMRNRSLNTQYTEKDKNGHIRKLDLTGEAVNTYCSHNILTFGHNYLNYPSITELAGIVQKRMESA